MTSITTTLTTSGNSVAVRLPAELLRMSGLGNRVKLEAREGKIIITSDETPRKQWAAQIEALAADTKGVAEPTAEFKSMEAAAADGLDDLPWDGPSFEEWQRSRKA